MGRRTNPLPVAIQTGCMASYCHACHCIAREEAQCLQICPTHTLTPSVCSSSCWDLPALPDDWPWPDRYPQQLSNCPGVPLLAPILTSVRKTWICCSSNITMGRPWLNACVHAGPPSSVLPDIFEAIRPVIGAFQTLGVPYHIGGSVASSALGIARTTIDVDLVADIHSDQIGPLVKALQDEYYIDGDTIADAVTRFSSFNLVHLATMLKVDVFIPGESPYARKAFSRRRRDRLAEDADDEVYFSSAEDLILHKLDWYRKGGETSERQWGDLRGVLKVQGDALDRDYLSHWAQELGLADMLDRALHEVGLD